MNATEFGVGGTAIYGLASFVDGLEGTTNVGGALQEERSGNR
jgi:hypothetical protein